jgi:hypothetical protein
MTGADTPQFGRVPTGIVLDGHVAGLTPAAQAVYLAVCAADKPDWSSRIGMRKIAKALGLHLSTVHDASRQLREAGLLTVDIATNGAATTYHIIPDRSGGRERSDDADRSGGRERSDDADRSGTGERSNTDRSDLGGATVRIQCPDRSGVPEQDRGTDREQSARCTAGAADGNGEAQADPVAYTFTTADGKPWRLRRWKLHELREAYPFVHVDTELEGIGQWLERNPAKAPQPAGMWTWLRRLLARKQSERPLSTSAYYGDGFVHTQLPTDPTGPEVDRMLAEAENDG